MKVTGDIMLTVLLPLILGVLIYYLTRSHSIYFLKWFDQITNLKMDFHPHLPTWIIFQLPDLLWTFTFSSLLLIIWNRNINNESISWLFIALLVSVIVEITIGTFDSSDLLFILIGLILSYIHPKNKFSFKTKTNE